MSEYGKKKLAGDRQISARAWNALTAAETFPRAQPATLQTLPRDLSTVRHECGGGVPADPFYVQRVTTATWEDRSDTLFDREGMRSGVEVTGDTIATEWDPVSVMQKSAPAGGFVPGVVSGPTPCRVLFPDAESLAFPYAIPIPGDPSKLKASPYGLHRILWHAEPETPQVGCDPRVLQSYVCMGEDGQWAFFKLSADLPCCGSASAELVDQCGSPVGSCPIIREVWGPQCVDLCACDSTPSGWKMGDVVPCWWYQYLEKWVTIPNFTANFETKEIEIVTGGAISGAEISVSDAQFVTGVAWNGGTISVTETEEIQFPTLGTVTLSGEEKTLVGGVTYTPPTLSTTTAQVPTTTAGAVSVALETEPHDVIASVTHTPCTLSTASESVSIPDAVSLSGAVTLTKEPVQALSGATFHADRLELSPTLESVVKSATLDASKLTLTMSAKELLTGVGATLTGLSGSVTYKKATGLDFSGVTFSVTLPTLSREVVTSVSVDGCDVVGTTEVVRVLDPEGVATVSMSGAPSLTYSDQTAAVTFTGGAVTLSTATESVQIPTGLQIAPGALSVTSESVVKSATISERQGESALSTTTETLQIPTAATVTLSGELTGAPRTLLTSATLTPGEVTTTTETLQIPTEATGEVSFSQGDSVTVVTGATLTPGSVTTSTESVTVPTSAALELSGWQTCEVPTAFAFEIEPLAVTKAPVQAEVSGGSISFTTDTVSVLACKPCTEEGGTE